MQLSRIFVGLEGASLIGYLLVCGGSFGLKHVRLIQDVTSAVKDVGRRTVCQSKCLSCDLNIVSLIRSLVHASKHSLRSSDVEEQGSDGELLGLGVSARTFTTKQEGRFCL